MALETGTYISDLVATNPLSTDPKSAGDDHLRLIKSTIKTTFPNISGAVTPTHTELNFVDGVTSAIQAQMDTKGAHAGQAWTGTHTFPTQTASDNSTKAATTAYADLAVGVESTRALAAEALLAPKASPALTGTPTAPTASTGTSTTQLATTAFVGATAFNAALPSQAGNSGKFVTTDGTNASWAATQEPLVSGSNIKTINGNSMLGAGDVAVGGGAWVHLSTVTASTSATVDIETTFDSTYDHYALVASNIRVAGSTLAQFYARLKIGGIYQSDGSYAAHTAVNTNSATAYTAVAGTNEVELRVYPVDTTSADTSNDLAFTMYIARPASTNRVKPIYWTGCGTVSLGMRQVTGAGAYRGSTGALTGIRFYFSAGTVGTGVFRLYGIKNS